MEPFHPVCPDDFSVQVRRVGGAAAQPTKTYRNPSDGWSEAQPIKSFRFRCRLPEKSLKFEK
jgi:hypothetical protein